MKEIIMVAGLLGVLAGSAQAVEPGQLALLISRTASAGALVGQTCGLEVGMSIIVNHLSPEEALIDMERCVNEGLRDEQLDYKGAQELLADAIGEAQ